MGKIFNLNGIYRASSIDRKYSLSLGCFAGAAGASIFDAQTQGGGPIGRVMLYDDTLVTLRRLLKAVQDKKEKMSISMSICKFDKDLKQYIPTSKIIVGRDENLVIYVDFNVENLKETVRFSLNGPASFLINEETPKDMVRSEIGCEKLIEAIGSCFTGMLLTREDFVLKEATANREKRNGGASSGVAKSTFEDDIQF